MDSTIVFDQKKTYKLCITREGQELIFTATNVKIIGRFLSFNDRTNQQFVFPEEFLTQAKEVKE